MKIKLLILAILFIMWMLSDRKDRRGTSLAIGTGILYAWMICGGLSAYSLGTEEIFWGRVLSLMVTTFIYIAALLLLKRIIRKKFSSRMLLDLWTSLAVVSIGLARIFSEDSLVWKDALIQIEIPKQILLVIGIVWAIGAIANILIVFLRHKAFYDELRDGSIEILDKDLDISRALRNVQSEIGEGPNVKLAFSPKIESPITVGLLEECIFIPQREYTEKELEWILRHELVHTASRDNIKKFLIMAFCATFWFIPFIKKSARFVAEEIEVACDEQVLRIANGLDKREYINLIMNDYGENRGFATCLSASGEGIKYRIEKILNPQEGKRFLDTVAILFGLAFLTLTIGMVQFVAI